MTTPSIGNTETYATGYTIPVGARPFEMTATRRVSWGAIFAGLIVGLVVQLALSLLGAGIGAGTINPAGNSVPNAGNFGIGSAIWLGVSTLLSLFAGSWVAGRLANVPRGAEAVIHGLVVWGLSTLATVYLLTTAVGAIFGGATSLLGSGLSAGAQGIAAASPAISRSVGTGLQKSGINAGTIISQAQQTLQETGNPKLQPGALAAQGKHVANESSATAQNAAANPALAKSDQSTLIARLAHEVGGTVNAADRTSLINVIQARTHTTRAQATRTADEYIAQARAASASLQQNTAKVEQGARQAATATATGVSRGALTAFILLLLGAIVAGLGGNVGARAERERQELPPPSNRGGIEYRSAAAR